MYSFQCFSARFRDFKIQDLKDLKNAKKKNPKRSIKKDGQNIKCRL